MATEAVVRYAGRVQPIHALADLARSFGPAAARQKVELLAAIAERPRCSAPDLVRLHDVLLFLRAHPDDAAVLRRVQALVQELRPRCERLVRDGELPASLQDSGVPGAANRLPMSLAVLHRLLAGFPGSLELDWDELEDKGVLHDTISVLVSPSECASLDEVAIGTRQWLERASASVTTTALGYLVRLFDQAAMPEPIRQQLFESCALPIRYRLDRPGSGRGEVVLEHRGICYQRNQLDRRRFPLPPRIRKPVGTRVRLTPAAGRRVLDQSLHALCSRNLEIYPLSHGEPRDVVRFAGARGLDVYLCGVEPSARFPLESLYFFLVCKNGVPIAYGPTSLVFGCAELGINLFPEFRGGEIRQVYAEVMRALYHELGARYFYLTAYGMGLDNEAAIATGAFWFYRKLGFRPSNPAVERLAGAEEERMAQEPGYRSSRRVLRRLADTEAFLDLSGGRCRRFDSTALALRVTRQIEAEFGGDRERAERLGAERSARWLGVQLRRWTPPERFALRRLAPVLGLLPERLVWTAAQKAALAWIARGKAASSETRATRRLNAHARLEAELRAVIEAGPDE